MWEKENMLVFTIFLFFGYNFNNFKHFSGGGGGCPSVVIVL